MSQGEGDKRKVSTDALETLGTIISENEKRDAIHLAVEPVVATVSLRPGEHVAADGFPVWPNDPRAVGIVDPFLKQNVLAGERFWLVVYPRQIHSLRHVWTHPAFHDAEEIQIQNVQGDATELTGLARKKMESVKWIKDYADRIGLHWKVLMEGADAWVESKRDKDNWGEYLVQGGTLEGTSTPDEFWTHYEIVRNVHLDHEVKTNFFSCSC